MSYENFVMTKVVTPVAIGATSFALFDAVAPARLPAAGGGSLVLCDSPHNPSFVEVVTYTSRTDLGIYGVVRGQEGTSAREWTGNVYVYQALMAGETNSLMADVASKAPLASPALTGTPTAPTAAPGTNTQQLANTAFVQAALAALIDASPGALDTLNELAAALGDDPNFAATMTAALAGKQPLDATLTALAALATAADKLIYATGNDTFATSTLTALARNLLDDSTTAAMQATLELIKQTSTTDITAGRLMLNGAHGIGGVVVSSDTALNNYTVGGKYVTPLSGVTNLPTGWVQARNVIDVSGGDGNYTVQMITGASSNIGKTAIRSFNGVSWSVWVELWNSDNLVKQANSNDSGAGRVMLTGAFGLGNTTTGVDAETVSGLLTGFYHTVVGTTTFTPPAGLDANGSLFNQVRTNAGSSAQAFQMWTHTSTRRTFIRSGYLNAWGSWRELLAAGDFGLGAGAVSLTSINLNTDLATGFYYCSSCTNSPAGNGWLLVEKLNSVYAYQTFSSVGAAKKYIRFNSNGVWQPWVEQLGAGAYGLGGRIVFKSGSDLNALTETGFTTESNPVNAPNATTTNLLNMYNPDASGRSVQLAQTVTTEDYYLRSQSGGTWSTWKKLFHQGSILGTVSQSGGVPTGAVIERGSNANGEYVKFADGTMICIKSPPVGDFGASSAYGTGGIYQYQATWVFPAAFIAMPACSGCGVDQGGYGWVGGGSSGSGTSVVLVYFAKVSSLSSSSIKFIAIGRWF